MVDYDPETIEKLLVAGWIERDGNHLKMTAKGQAALRRGFVGGVPGEQKLAIDSGRARARPSIRKKRSLTND
jgi:hypothetical protein